MRRSIVGLTLGIMVGGWTGGCASGPESRPNVSYRVSAKENFEKGKKAYENGDHQEAIEFLNFVKNKFPFSSYAADADLLLADCDFARDKTLEAAEGYSNFIKMHPKHPKVAYAMYRIGMCYYKRIPDNWWFMPPSYEMDQEETERAIQEISRYLKQFPQDENAAEAQKNLDNCRRRMAETTHYVMEFYYSREHPRAVLWRAEQLLSKYSGLGFDEEALFRKAQALVNLGEVTPARAAIEQLLQKYPESEYSKRAQDLLVGLATTTDKPTVVPGGAPQ